VSWYPDAVLVIAGAGPNHERIRLERLARALGVDRALELVGWVPDVYDLMAAADVFVQSSIDEACPQTIIEARGLGVPLATTTVAGVGEVVGEDHEAIAAGDDNQLAGRVVSLLAAPEAARAVAAGAVRTTRKQFSAAAMTDAYVSLYTRLAGSPGRPAGTNA
jgi:glycosyltransferase involved in cell wall biosynthesis